jgi:hypothetical protein
VRGRRRQSSFNDADVERQTSAELSSKARTLIGAIVGEDGNTYKRRRNWAPETVALLGKGAQTCRQALFFISDWYGDNEAWSDGQDKPRGRQRKGRNPCAGWVVKHRES